MTSQDDLSRPHTRFDRRAVWRAVAGAGLALSLAATAGCSTIGVLNALSVSPAVSVTRDIAYGADPRQKLDVYAPSAPAPGRPVVVFFYGGSWDSGSKHDYAFVGQALAAEGYVAVVPDYRVYPQVVWPAFLQDSASAVRWARDHAAEHGGAASRLVLMGHSAGAYNAIDLAVDGRWLSAAGVDPTRDIAAVVGLSGPYDFLPVRTDELKAIFGPEAQRPDTQPINHVDGHAPPMLLITGDKDTTVDPGNSDRMAAKLRAAGDQVDVIHYPKLTPPLTVAALSGPLRFLAPVLRDVSAFIDQRTGWTRPAGG
jgi:acetyl esterase/lipase